MKLKIKEIILKYRIHISLVFANVLFLFSNCTITINNITAIISFTLCNIAFHVYNKAKDNDADRHNLFTDDINLTIEDEKRLIGISYLLAFTSILLIIITRQSLIPILIYSSLIYLYNFNKINLKKYLFIKNLYMAIFYAVPFTFYTYFYMGTPLTHEKLPIFIHFVLMVLAFESIWDIKDIEGDRYAGITTIPNKFGIPFTKVYAIILISIASFIQYHLFHQFSLVSIILLSSYIVFINKKSSHLWYHMPVIAILIYQYYSLFWEFHKIYKMITH